MWQTAFVIKWGFRFALLPQGNVANHLLFAFGLGYARLPRRAVKPKTYPREAQDLPTQHPRAFAPHTQAEMYARRAREASGDVGAHSAREGRA